MMLLSVVLYLLAKRLEQKPHLQYWQTAIVVFECIGLLLFYLFGNYYVIRESSIQYFGVHLTKGADIPFAIFFYLFMAIIPLVNVFYGFKRKDRILLWIGLGNVALSAVTFKYYFSTGYPKIILIIVGMLLMGIGYTAIQ